MRFEQVVVDRKDVAKTLNERVLKPGNILHGIWTSGQSHSYFVILWRNPNADPE